MLECNTENNILRSVAEKFPNKCEADNLLR